MTDRKVTLRVTKDGGRNWNNSRERPIGDRGEYHKRITFNRLGQARTVSIAIRVSSPVKATLLGAAAKVTPADS